MPYDERFMAGGGVDKQRRPERPSLAAASPTVDLESQVGKGPAVAASTGAAAKKPGPKTGYAQFLAEDPRSKIIMADAIGEMVATVWAMHVQHTEQRSFPVVIVTPMEITKKAYSIPSQIGRHRLWLQSNVTIKAENGIDVFHVDMTVIAEPYGHTKFNVYKFRQKFRFKVEDVNVGPRDDNYQLEA